MRFLFPIVCCLVACSPLPSLPDASVPVVSPDAGEPDAGLVDAGLPDAGVWRFEAFSSRVVPVGSAVAHVELIRAHRPDGERSYLLYVHALSTDGGVAPVVIANQPYDGIDWTNEPVDVKWATRGAGTHADDDAPAYNGVDVAGYTPLTVESQVSGDAVHLLNGFAIVHAYGRFYAGGSVEDDIRDATAPYHFVLSRPTELDLSRVGSFGGSWGGLMAIFGAARAPAGLTLKSLVPLTPPSDLAGMHDWITTDGPAVFMPPATFTSFFSPYRRRIEAATLVDGGVTTPQTAPAAWSPYQHAAVCAGLRATQPQVKVLSPHDEWDTLVPVTQTRELVAACPDLVTPLYWPRDGDPSFTTLDHGPMGAEPGLPSVFTFAYLHLALELTREDQTALTAGVPAAIDSYLTLLDAERDRGGDVSHALPTLRLLCHPRARYFDGVTMTIQDGAALLSGSVNRVLGASTTPQTVCAALQNALP